MIEAPAGYGKTAADLLTSLTVSAPCCLILDNFQLIGDNRPLPLLRAPADRRRDGLHVILISQNFGKLRAVFESAAGVSCLFSRDFLLRRKHIGAYGRQLGLELSRHPLSAQVQRLFRGCTHSRRVQWPLGEKQEKSKVSEIRVQIIL